MCGIYLHFVIRRHGVTLEHWDTTMKKEKKAVREDEEEDIEEKRERRK